MARSRNVKPGFFKNEDLAGCTALARLVYIGLWTLADKEGRLEDRPKRIKAELLPYDEAAVEPLLDELAGSPRSGGQPFIRRYTVDGQRFIDIPTFKKHQNPHHREHPSEIPEYQPALERHVQASAEPVQAPENPELAVLIPDSPTLIPDSPIPHNAAEKLAAASVQPKPKSVHVDFVDRFKAHYEAQTGQPYQDDKADFVIASALIKKHGPEAVIQKARTLARLCKKKSAWFTEDGWAAFTIRKLRARWNEILVESDRPTEEDEFQSELKKQEAHNARVSQVLGR